MSYSSGSTLYYAGCEDHLYEQHFLQSCSLCSKPLGCNSDIYMYRGDTPFCSQECRQEQIDVDTAKERSSMQKKKMTSSSSSSSSNKNVRSGTVAVA